MKNNISKRQIGNIVYALARTKPICAAIEEIYITIDNSGITEEYLLVTGQNICSSQAFDTKEELLDSIAKQLEE